MAKPDPTSPVRPARAACPPLGRALIAAASFLALCGVVTADPPEESATVPKADPARPETTPPEKTEAAKTPEKRQTVAEQTAERLRVGWLQQHARTITIDPADDDDVDLMALAEAIGNARVVLLGEQSHGDGSTFLAKSRIVKFLHKQMGFDVLAFESGMYDMRRVDRGMTEEPTWNLACGRGLFGIWSMSEQCRNLMEYVHASHRTGKPLELAGFDNQYTFELKDSPYWDDLDNFFTAAAIQSGKNLMDGEISDYLTQLKVWHMERSFMGDAREPDLTKLTEEQAADYQHLEESLAKQRASMLGALEKLAGRMEEDLASEEPSLLRAHSRREAEFMRRTVLNLRSFSRQIMLSGTKLSDPKDVNLRDIAMGENLVWLGNEYYRGRKIIVWAASMHNAHDVKSITVPDEPGFYDGTITMGEGVHKALGKEAYSVMFTAFDGRIGRPWTDSGPIEPAPRDSLEWLLKRAGFENAFLDFRTLPVKDDSDNPLWLRERTVSRPLGHVPMMAKWGDCFDGVVYTQKMVPSTQAKLPAAPAKEAEKPAEGAEEGAERKGPRH
jgi:erythromycin esterase